MRGLLALALERGGHEVLQAGTVEEADALLDSSGEVEGMLLDLHLGGGHSGVSVVEHWRASERLAPFLVVTGTPEDPSLQSIQDESLFRGVLGKPFMIDELQRRANALLQPSEAESEPEAETAPQAESEPEAAPAPAPEIES